MRFETLKRGPVRVALSAFPIRPANRPVNASTHDQGGLPGPDIDARIPPHKSGSFVREGVEHV